MSMMANAPRETLGAGSPLDGTHSSLKPTDALNKAGQLGRDARDLGLQISHTLSRLAGPLLTRSHIADVSAAPGDTLNQPLLSELRVGGLHGHQGYAELLGVGAATRETVPRTERPCGDLVSDPGGDFAGVGLPRRL